MTKSQRTLILFFLIATLPVVASYVLFALWKPESHTNHGELLALKSAGLGGLKVEGSTISVEQAVAKKWIFLTVQPAECEVRCQKKLYLMRQIRIAQNEGMAHVERVWVITGEGKIDPQLLKQHTGLYLARVGSAKDLPDLMLGKDPGAYIYLIDPKGNLVLRYDDQKSPKGILKDLAHLLRFSGLV